MKKSRSLKNDRFSFRDVFTYSKVLSLFDNMSMNFHPIYSSIFAFFHHGGRHYLSLLHCFPRFVLLILASFSEKKSCFMHASNVLQNIRFPAGWIFLYLRLLLIILSLKAH